MTLTPPMIYTPGPLSPCFTVIMTLTHPMILHTRPIPHALMMLSRFIYTADFLGIFSKKRTSGAILEVNFLAKNAQKVTITQFCLLCIEGTAEQAKKSYFSVQLGES